MNTIIGIFAKPLAYLLLAIYNVIGNYGVTLILVTILVKCCLYPLYIKQMKSTITSAGMQGKMMQIQQKYANDREMMNQKLAELYKEEGFNPAGGCLPMLIQMPIIFALFALLRNPMAYISGANMNEMLWAVHESFFWIEDLSQPDKWVLPILAGIATFVAFNISQQSAADSSPAGDMGGMMKMMKYFYPVMIVLMGRTFPSGLALYWFFGQFLQIFFNLHMRTLRKKLKDEKNKKGKAKGGKK